MDYFLSMFFMLISSRGNFTSYFEVFYYILDAVLIYVGITRRIFKTSDFKLLFTFIAIYLTFMVLRYIFFNDLPVKFLLSDVNFLVQRFIFSFLFCAVLREKTLYYMVKVTYDLAFLSIIFYVLQRVSPPVVEWVGKIIFLPPRIGNPGYCNFIVFTYDSLNHPGRNCGFSWEPGAYGCFLDMALLLHLVITGFKFDKKCIVFLLAILTTLSTTTYIGVVIIALLYLRVNGLKLSTLLITLVPLIAIVATQVPFLFDKIGKTYSDDQIVIARIESLTAWNYKHGGELSLNRFGSMIYLINEFGNKLWMGVSNGYQDATKIATLLNISNGDFDFITKFGVVGLLYLIYKYAQVLKKFLFRNEFIFYCIILLLALGFGEPMLIFTTTLCFVFLPQYIIPELYLYGQEDPVEDLSGEETFEENYTPTN